MKALLFDLDGVLYQGDQAIAGATDTLAWVRDRGIRHRFVTNTTSRPRSALVDKLARMGIQVDRNELLTPAVAAANWLGQRTDRAVALFLPDATREEFERFDILAGDADSGAGAVIVGDLGAAWDFATLNRAFRLLMDEPQPYLVALGMTRYWQAADGLRLDTGAFVSALAYASSTEPTVLGKPARGFFEQALEGLGTPAAETAMVGDDIVSDIGAAQGAGLAGIQVRTGKFRPADLDGDIEPSAVIDSIAELPGWWAR